MYLNTTEKKQVNILKVMAVILVVYIHSYSIGGVTYADEVSEGIAMSSVLFFFEEFISNGICSSAVAIMFIVSGYCSMQRKYNYRTLLKKKASSLLLPYLFWNVVWIAIFGVLQMFSLSRPFFSDATNIIRLWGIREWLGAFGISISLKHPFVYPLWFMRDLMIVFVFYPLLRLLVERWAKAIVVIAAFLLFIPVDWSIKNSFCYFAIGMALFRCELRIEHSKKMKSVWIILPWLVGLIANTFIHNSYIKIICVLLGCLVYIRMSILLNNVLIQRRNSHFIEKEAFLIYATHELTLTCFKKICYRLLPQFPVVQWMEYLLLPVLLILLICIFGTLLRGMFPRFHLIVTGSR